MHQQERNNSWDAFWQDAGKGFRALLLVGLFLVFIFFSFKVFLILLGLVALFLFLNLSY